MIAWLDDGWSRLISGRSSFDVMVTGTLALILGTYYTFGLLHLLTLDCFHLPRWLYSSKIQPTKHLDVHRLPSLFSNLITNQLFILVPTAFAGYYLSCGRFGGDTSDLTCIGGHALPDLFTVARDLAVFVIIEEVLFFYSHLMLHRWFYDQIHRKHHEFTSPIALAASYCHPLEMLLANVLPLFAGPQLMRSHHAVALLWYFVAIIGTMIHHCGYDFPWLFGNQPRFHDLHHERYTVNYGLLGILDWLHGTYETREHKIKK